MGGYTECPYCEFNGRNSQSLEDHIEWTHPVKNTKYHPDHISIEADQVDLTIADQIIPIIPKTPKRVASSPVRSPETKVCQPFFLDKVFSYF